MPKISPPYDLVVHATHEAGAKVGGIGAVLNGLLATSAYDRAVARTILVGPVDTEDETAMSQLAGSGCQLRYSARHSIDDLEPGLGDLLRSIEKQYKVKLLYGSRAFGATWHEIILVDAQHTDPKRVNRYKAKLYHHFGIQSDRYESDPEFSLYVDAADPSYVALRAIVSSTGPLRFMVAHEFMGLPLCYSAMIHDPRAYQTVFYGHEVATVRPLVESHPGHDTMFYNVLAQALEEGRYLEDVFGDQSAFFKDALIRPAAKHCDRLFAVSDSVGREMRFLSADWQAADIRLVYNGVPSREISLSQKRASHSLLQRYCASLLGYKPDYVFSHVTRLVPSKGLWRDLRVMEHLDTLLARMGKRAVLIVLSSAIPSGRPSRAIRKMESLYGWPVNHRQAPVLVDRARVPDLVSHEIPFYDAITGFNRRAQASQIVLINQFGWSRDRCGEQMPREMSFVDLRQGTDLEFGQSIYEPFGIAQLEPLCFGALCVISSVCGCLDFVRRAGGPDHPGIAVADYVGLAGANVTVASALQIDRITRDRIESAESTRVAADIVRRLPTDDAAAQEMIEQGYALSRSMSWEVVVKDYLIPGLAGATSG